MPESLFASLLHTFDRSGISQIAGTLGESEQGVSRGIESSMASVLGAMAGKSEDPGALRRMLDCLVRVEAVVREGAHAEIAARVEEARAAFSAAVQDDLNTAAALGAIFELVRALNSAVDAGQIGRDDVPVVRDAFDEFDRVLGVLSLRRAEDAQPPVPKDEIEKRIEDRHAARRRTAGDGAPLRPDQAQV